jgi:hypothetical protein
VAYGPPRYARIAMRDGTVTDVDMVKFEALFKRAYLASQVRWKAEDYTARVGLYFRRLRFAPFEDVALAMGNWFDVENKFPSIAEWRRMLPANAEHAVDAPPDTRIMGTSEIAEWNQAHEWKYQAAPCSCFACVEASVNHLELRYVPMEDADGRLERAWHGGRKELVYVGEWIHGEALKRWYEARARFYASVERMSPGLRRALRNIVPIKERLTAIFEKRTKERDPGEEG